MFPASSTRWFGSVKNQFLVLWCSRVNNQLALLWKSAIIWLPVLLAETESYGREVTPTQRSSDAQQQREKSQQQPTSMSDDEQKGVLQLLHPHYRRSVYLRNEWATELARKRRWRRKGDTWLTWMCAFTEYHVNESHDGSASPQLLFSRRSFVILAVTFFIERKTGKRSWRKRRLVRQLQRWHPCISTCLLTYLCA